MVSNFDKEYLESLAESASYDGFTVSVEFVNIETSHFVNVNVGEDTYEFRSGEEASFFIIGLSVVRPQKRETGSQKLRRAHREGVRTWEEYRLWEESNA